VARLVRAWRAVAGGLPYCCQPWSTHRFSEWQWQCLKEWSWEKGGQGCGQGQGVAENLQQAAPLSCCRGCTHQDLGWPWIWNLHHDRDGGHQGWKGGLQEARHHACWRLSQLKALGSKGVQDQGLVKGTQLGVRMRCCCHPFPSMMMQVVGGRSWRQRVLWIGRRRVSSGLYLRRATRGP